MLGATWDLYFSNFIFTSVRRIFHKSENVRFFGIVQEQVVFGVKILQQKVDRPTW